MKQYDRFGEYMFDLLFAPLKKGKRTANQLYVFFKVIGRVFDSLKDDALRVRDEANIATASPIMLPIHGQDRNMPRLAGEGIEGYRTRLAMKGIISEWGGTRRGILYALAALGYEHSHIESVGPEDPTRWAEFIVHLGVGNVNSVKNFYAIYYEIQRVKEGSSRLACVVFTMKPICAVLRVGGISGTVVQMCVPVEPDKPRFRDALRIGGTGAVCTALPILEDNAPPSATTILRTGGVCTILSNLSKGE